MNKLTKPIITSSIIGIICIISVFIWKELNSKKNFHINDYIFKYDQNLWIEIESETVGDAYSNQGMSDKLIFKQKSNNLVVTFNLYKKNIFVTDNVPININFGAPREYYLEPTMIQDFFDYNIDSKKILVKCDYFKTCSFFEQEDNDLYWNYFKGSLGYKAIIISAEFYEPPTEKEIDEVIELIKNIHNAKKIN